MCLKLKCRKLSKLLGEGGGAVGVDSKYAVKQEMELELGGGGGKSFTWGGGGTWI